jgi:hypothetical protein
VFQIRRLVMKRFAVLAAALAIACPAVMTSGIVYADEIVVTPEQWGAATSPAAPGQWRHLGTTGDTGATPAMEEKEAAPAKEGAKEPEGTKETKETKGAKETAGTNEAKEAPSTGAKKKAAPEEAVEAPQETKAPEYRIFNLNLPPEPPKPQAAPAQLQPAPAPVPGYIEKSGMVIPSMVTPGGTEPPGRTVTVTPEK